MLKLKKKKVACFPQVKSDHKNLRHPLLRGFFKPYTAGIVYYYNKLLNVKDILYTVLITVIRFRFCLK